MATFLHQLVQVLDQETPGWQENTWIQMDNAPYHTSDETRAAMKALGLNICFSGPYAYDGSPVELLFAHLKLGKLNPEQEPTGKR